MESTVVSDVREIMLTMDIREALRFLEDPEHAQEHVRGQLKGHGLDLPEGNGRAPKLKGPRASKGRKTGANKCDRCGEGFKTAGGLKHHITVMHPETLKG